ncbi:MULTISPECIES: hypothetical protein [unclassified Caulobacter]|uniref:hypothetical protein n=1 Tax=unclassified Caulobacter TaxID=2648921 RepID=UPI000D3D6B3F|nr:MULTISPECIES: hypothetical protein [unclassified Caulobacter]PTS87047.1 hypothetical protein DBR21_13645 [Caulobacter sp. HMWF009]PTT08999.1 hypothetical protein DBR10_07985 [Caulobacter sp. HMWF025]
MSRLAKASFATLLTCASLLAGPVQAQAQGERRPPPSRGAPCGAAMTGTAPDIMTYDRATGTQVFVGGGRGDTEVSAYNTQTGSVAALNGDLSKPGLVSSCAFDGINRESYGVTSERPGQLSVSGRDLRGDRWAFTRADGQVEVWDPRGDNRCFKSGLGIFTPSGGLGLAVATPPGAAGVGLAAGDRFAGVGVGGNRNFAGVGLVGC